jgi:2'-5' RNA ligase
VRTRPIACTLASVGAFPAAEGVLFLAPAASVELVQLQLEVLERLRQTGAEIEPYWLPRQWVPHCTLAIGFPPEMPRQRLYAHSPITSRSPASSCD